MLVLVVLVLAVCSSMSLGFRPVSSRSRGMKLYEDFRLDKTTIVSDPLIFSEKQLRENLPEPEERWNPFAAFLPDFSGIFSGEGAKPASRGATLGGASAALRSSVSPELLESRTSEFVKGKIDAKKFSTTLKAAFGDKLGQVLPEILANLPADKSAALKKVVK